MRYLAVVLFTALIVPFTPIVFGPPDFSDQEKFNTADVILTGKIISFSQPDPPPNMLSSLDTIYEIQIDKYIKNPLGQDIISVIASGGPDAEMGPRIGNVNFDVGDIVYLFLREDDDSELYRVSTFTSYLIETTCDPIPDELSHLTDEPSSWEFQTTDSEFNEKQIFAVNEEIIIRFDVTNAKPTTRTLTYDIAIHDGERKDDRTTFHTESKDITLPACVGHAILEWHFTPTQEMDYFVDIRNDGRGTGFGFPVTSDGSTPSNYYDQPIVEYSVLKQHKMKIPDDQLMCKRDGAVLAFRNNDKPACFMPDTLAKLLERGWIGKKSYVPTPDLNLFGKVSSSEIAFDAAQKFIDSSKTVTFDDSERSGGFSNLSNKMVNSTSVYLLEGDFTTDTTGYGDRTNQEYFETQTHHSIVVKIKDSDVVYAVIDNQWDEINQEFVAKRSENFKDFEVRYQKFFGQEEKDHHIQLESKPGLIRITTTPDDTFYRVEHSEFEKFRSTVIENKFFDITQSVQHCETCISHSLKIESGGTHNTVSWNEGDVMDERLHDIISSLDTISQNQYDDWTT